MDSSDPRMALLQKWSDEGLLAKAGFSSATLDSDLHEGSIPEERGSLGANLKLKNVNKKLLETLRPPQQHKHSNAHSQGTSFTVSQDKSGKMVITSSHAASKKKFSHNDIKKAAITANTKNPDKIVEASKEALFMVEKALEIAKNHFDGYTDARSVSHPSILPEELHDCYNWIKGYGTPGKTYKNILAHLQAFVTSNGLNFVFKDYQTTENTTANKGKINKGRLMHVLTLIAVKLLVSKGKTSGHHIFKIKQTGRNLSNTIRSYITLYEVQHPAATTTGK